MTLYHLSTYSSYVITHINEPSVQYTRLGFYRWGKDSILKAARWMTRLKRWWRTWQAAISCGELKVNVEPQMSEWDFSKQGPLGLGNTGNWSVLVPVGKEINWDAVSKSDWKRCSPNWIRYSNIVEMWCWGLLLRPMCGSEVFWNVTQ